MLSVAAFLIAFFALRQRSTFLRIENDRATAGAVAAAHGLSLAAAMALRDLIGVDAPVDDWQRAAADFAALRQRLGEPLAAVAIAGERPAAEAALLAAGDAERAWQQFRVDARALAGLRFLQLRERFAARIATRD